jgi:hypothetical protein
MPSPELRAEARFNRLVLGGWWLAVAVIGLLRLLRGDLAVTGVLFASATFTVLLGVALSIDRERGGVDDAPDAEALRLQKAIMLFSVIAISTVVGCAVINHAIWWAAVECAAVIWILPAVILPLVQAYIGRRSEAADWVPEG